MPRLTPVKGNLDARNSPTNIRGHATHDASRVV
jgi:hypothetical protein